ncbi:MAG: thioredoxin family protein, partial [Caulobacterales bacterium]|nr:thioredoxin family protein [Caulobacterales bacterium]
MALAADIKSQLSQYLTLLEGDIILSIDAKDDKTSIEMKDLVDEIASMSPRISVEKVELVRAPSFEVNPKNGKSGVTFAGVPLGHEFTSLVLALLQVSGRKPKIDDALIETIKNIKGKFHFETYISLTCHNCPDVVQALNTMAVLNPNITHTMIEGGAFKAEVDAKQIMAVPSIYLNGEFFDSGRLSLEEIIAKIDTSAGLREAEIINQKAPFDVLVLGGGPAGA